MGDVLSVVVVAEERKRKRNTKLALAECAGMGGARLASLPPVSIPSLSLSLYIRRVAKAGQSGIPRPPVSQYASPHFVPS